MLRPTAIVTTGTPTTTRTMPTTGMTTWVLASPAKGLLALHGFQPPASLSSHIFHGCLRLEHLRLVHELELQKQAQLQHARFLMGARFDEVTRFHGLRRILRHDEFREQRENGVFNALTERESPSLAQAFIHVNDLLVEFVRLVDDRERVHRLQFTRSLALLAAVCARKEAHDGTPSFHLSPGKQSQ